MQPLNFFFLTFLLKFCLGDQFEQQQTALKKVDFIRNEAEDSSNDSHLIAGKCSNIFLKDV